MSNKLSWRWQDRSRSAWGPPLSTTSPLCRSARARVSSLALQVDAAKFTDLLLRTSLGTISVWQQWCYGQGPLAKRGSEQSWRVFIPACFKQSKPVLWLWTDHTHCNGCWDLSSILVIVFLLLLSPLPGFHPALNGLRLLSSCCLLFYLLWLLLVSFFFFFIFSTACLRLVAPLSSAGWVPCVFFLLEWINGKNLMNVRSNIFI